MPVTIVKKEPVVAIVEVSDKEGDLIDYEEVQLGEVNVTDGMGKVGVKLGRTKNTGNYESLRVDISLEMPANTDKKSLNKTFKKCLSWCDAKMDEVLN